MTKPKKSIDMSLEELIEATRKIEMTPEEMENQDVAIAAAEARHSGNKTATKETVRAAMVLDEAKTKQSA